MPDNLKSQIVTANSAVADVAPLPEPLEPLIILLRGQRVMLSTHLAELYGVQPKALVQAVKRNPERFPDDFLFQLTDVEFADLRSQFVTANWSMVRATPYAFTEQGVAMLSSVLRSPRAVAVNVEIMRTFVRLRRLLVGNAELAQRLDALEAQTAAQFQQTDAQFQLVFDAIRELITPSESRQRRMGFREVPEHAGEE
jgi:hypothetical protein